MARFVVRRLLWTLILLGVVSLTTFVLMHEMPGGPFDSIKKPPQQVIENLEAYYHLDRPLWQQYAEYIYNVAVPRLQTRPPTPDEQRRFLIRASAGRVHLLWMDFGPSYQARGRMVSDIFREQLPVSAQLGVMAFLVAVAVGISLGIVAALRRDTWVDYATMAGAIAAMSLPVVFVGPWLVYILGLWLRVLPISGWGASPPFILGFLPRELSLDYFKYAVLPVLCMSLGGAAYLARLTRASLLEVIRQDYLRTARAKGLSQVQVIIRHALKPSLIPVATVLGPMLAGMVTGSFIIETIFGIPGVGRYFVTCVGSRDYPVIMATTLLAAASLIIANMIVDLAYAFLDPRLRIK